ncbi:helix-turn-helix domain-containing protein [Oenococcus kitaharae]|uniref:XRE-family transcriptional regulator n=1 Tax=Oenococcus kitaharae DSM 17330 TaxID=1045004 RepID=G9WGB9_9LACO|nr:helix-turn-helix transcriptional regulator [Oenococcus kitaharae]EHN59727.1 XRE-family transcriptional regulator [Oenococcus kitaharae DSM 17330]
MVSVNGEIFRQRRKELHLSQMQLADGIASQGTISSLECFGALPCMRILEEIMNRLHLSLEDVMSINPASSVLNNLQKELDNEHYRRVFDGLENVNKNDIVFPKDKQRLLYLRASAYFHSGRIEDASFWCDQLMQIPDKDKDPLYHALVHTIKAQVWQQKNDLYKASVCFQNVEEFLLSHNDKNNDLPSNAIHGYVRMYQALAEHALMNQNPETAQKYLRRAFKILKAENSSWHLGELLIIDAEIAGERMLDKEKTTSIMAAQRLYEIMPSPKLGRMLQNVSSKS